MLRTIKIIMTIAVLMVIVATAFATGSCHIAIWALICLVVGFSLCAMWNLKSAK